MEIRTKGKTKRPHFLSIIIINCDRLIRTINTNNNGRLNTILLAFFALFSYVLCLIKDRIFWLARVHRRPNNIENVTFLLNETETGRKKLSTRNRYITNLCYSK